MWPIWALFLVVIAGVFVANVLLIAAGVPTWLRPLHLGVVVVDGARIGAAIVGYYAGHLYVWLAVWLTYIWENLYRVLREALLESILDLAYFLFGWVYTAYEFIKALVLAIAASDAVQFLVHPYALIALTVVTVAGILGYVFRARLATLVDAGAAATGVPPVPPAVTRGTRTRGATQSVDVMS